ncbi:dehydrogenase/reductase SDR family member 11-like [Fopius arisanus]|uniref:Dehydrogenase/reductase SDR family member 11-like n=1 Tax=Fopius arisanus TaxID=64838 RepID=A0A9R1TXN6_9HYME|nr:PREDICTED: dehydrogenase/reductase SDR family member 11-like [Fopius arisanus]
MDRWTGKVAVITGASSGIGSEVVKMLVKKGMIVVGLARRKQKMEDDMKGLSGVKGRFYAVQCDISKDEDVAKAFAHIKKSIGTVQILVNTAGYATPGGFSVTTPEIWRGVVAVNMMGAMYCTKEVLTMLQESKLEGHIINMNSILGHRVVKFLDIDANVYAATKHAITGFSETLQRELIGQNIRITSISPGFVITQIVKENSFDTALLKEPALEPVDVADAVVYVIGTQPRVEVKELILKPLGERAF